MNIDYFRYCQRVEKLGPENDGSLMLNINSINKKTHLLRPGYSTGIKIIHPGVIIKDPVGDLLRLQANLCSSKEKRMAKNLLKGGGER